jgi:hypothetical protein
MNRMPKKFSNVLVSRVYLLSVAATRFVPVVDDHNSELQAWLSQKREQTTPGIRRQPIPKHRSWLKIRRVRSSMTNPASLPLAG